MSISPSPLILSVLLALSLFHSIAIEIDIGIGIGGGGDGGHYGPPPAPVPPPKPQPSDFPNERQYEAYKVIQRFKKTVTCDPNNVTQTWVGFRPCTYQGFYCETPPGFTNTLTIASVDFNGFLISAPTLAGFLDGLPDLALFHANSNRFSGTVPDLKGLPFLYELDVSNNILTGDFPATAVSLVNLSFLDLRFNRFSGDIPPSVFALRLDVFFINNNLFDGPLPANLGKSLVSYLNLANNGFNGPIPRSICNASNTLLEVLLLNNRLSGCLPTEIGQLKKATVFDAGGNQLTGPIPFSFGCLLNVEQLNFAVNRLYGEVPDVVCQLFDAGKLLNLSLSDNYFTSLGRSCWKLLEQKVLHVRRNCIAWLPDQRPPDQRPPAERAAFEANRFDCPLDKYMPCEKPLFTEDGDVELRGEAAAAPAPAYRAYSALLQLQGGAG